MSEIIKKKFYEKYKIITIILVTKFIQLKIIRLKNLA